MSGTRGVVATDNRKMSPYIQFGIQNLRINAVEIRTAKTGSKQCVFSMETRPVTVPDFEGIDGAQGQVGKVYFPRTWLKTEDPKALESFFKQIAIMGDKLGVRAQIDAVDYSDFDSYMNTIGNIIKNKYAWWKLVVEEYERPDKAPGKKLYIPKFGFIANEMEGESHLKFDKTNNYDYSAVGTTVQTADATPVDVAKDDLPF